MIDKIDEKVVDFGSKMNVMGVGLFYEIAVGIITIFYTTPQCLRRIYFFIPMEIITIYVFTCMIMCHILAYKTSPGTPKDMVSELSIRATEDTRNYCKLCEFPKPFRVHHCRTCEKCILKMEHHCPWVSNCIGYYNHRYFLSYLIYLFCFALCATTIAAPLALDYIAFPILKPSGILGFTSWRQGISTFAMAISGATAVTMGFFGGWHVHLALSGNTTIETEVTSAQNANIQYSMSGRLSANLFNLGHKNNWEIIFGKDRFFCSWAIPGYNKLDRYEYMISTKFRHILEIVEYQSDPLLERI